MLMAKAVGRIVNWRVMDLPPFLMDSVSKVTLGASLAMACALRHGNRWPPRNSSFRGNHALGGSSLPVEAMTQLERSRGIVEVPEGFEGRQRLICRPTAAWLLLGRTLPCRFLAATA